jgi:hypothetical protein
MNFETEIYYDVDDAVAAAERLHALGYSQDEISVLMDDKTRERAFSAITNVKGSEGVAAGATIGGVLGAIIVGLTATGTIVATGGAAAPLVVGPLAAALAGLGAGAVGGGIVGGLIGVGIGETRAHQYERGLREGGILLAVTPKSKEHIEKVRGALSDRIVRSTSGEVDMKSDYAGTLDNKRL